MSSAGCAGGDEGALVEDGDAVAEFLGFIDGVGGEENGAAGGFELGDEGVEFAAGVGIKAGGGLVEKGLGGC